MTTTSPEISKSDPRFATLYHSPSVAAEFVPRMAREVLDVGCGTGTTARYLSAKGLIVDGITWNPEEAALAATVCRSVQKCDLEKGIPNVCHSAYDAVICSHILEHIAYPQALMEDILKTLKPGGTLIVVIPNLFFWPERLKLIRGEWRYEKSGTFDYTHLRWYTTETMKDFLAASGFTISQFKAFGWVPLPGLRRVLTTSARNWLNQKACRMFPGLFGQQLLYCATKPTQH